VRSRKSVTWPPHPEAGPDAAALAAWLRLPVAVRGEAPAQRLPGAVERYVSTAGERDLQGMLLRVVVELVRRSGPSGGADQG
jgi:hypothetical protein